ncbi:class I SAM-dependent methyltransferase [Streptomyces clavuligerus]|uniref:Methyltransferase type 12 n=2 Tax=Streptomyces clavuligerus TaxID=1901 RepID=D5SIS7_STRCL|nr:class I SAM-dependent methyltransferase [Streptomyces clavuligerus]EFG03820.1 Methyltransferase type 12 [Streptomyces clavuligerus]QCS09793.1 class I SAM-dependent methyltransferase [Streptomyces clavuligerus]
MRHTREHGGARALPHRTTKTSAPHHEDQRGAPSVPPAYAPGIQSTRHMFLLSRRKCRMRRRCSADSDPPDYGDEIFASGHPAQMDRLRALAAVCDPVTKASLSEWALPPGARCLEIGAGAGTVALWLAGRCTGGEVTATDTDIRFMAGLQHPALRVLQHDVRTQGFPEETFDLIVARSVLCHLPEREAVLARMVSWLRPGGRLHVEDPSFFPAASSADPVVRRLGGAVIATLAGTLGSDVDGWARSFPAPLLGLGLAEVGMRVHCPTLTSKNAAGTAWRLSVAELLPVMDRLGVLPEADTVEALAHLEHPEFADVAHAMIGMWGVRPAGRPGERRHGVDQTG